MHRKQIAHDGTPHLQHFPKYDEKYQPMSVSRAQQTSHKEKLGLTSCRWWQEVQVWILEGFGGVTRDQKMNMVLRELTKDNDA